MQLSEQLLSLSDTVRPVNSLTQSRKHSSDSLLYDSRKSENCGGGFGGWFCVVLLKAFSSDSYRFDLVLVQLVDRHLGHGHCGAGSGLVGLIFNLNSSENVAAVPGTAPRFFFYVLIPELRHAC